MINREKVLNQAIDLTDGQVYYANNIRFTVSNNDVTLDFYRTGPNPNNPTGESLAHRTHRIVIPVSLAKDVSGLLANAMSDWEDTFGITLPIMPTENEAEDE